MGIHVYVYEGEKQTVELCCDTYEEVGQFVELLCTNSQTVSDPKDLPPPKEIRIPIPFKFRKEV